MCTAVMRAVLAFVVKAVGHGHSADTRTAFQKHTLRVLILLLRDYPGFRLCGYRDLSPNLSYNGDRTGRMNKGMSLF